MEETHVRQHNTFKTDTKTHFFPLILMFTSLILASCADNPLQPVSSEEEQRIKAELNDRSFRQFDPSKDADKRKGVILDFFNGVGLWAQYAEGPYALNEWEILSDDYRIEKAGSEYRIILRHRVPNKYSQPSATIASKPQASPFRSRTFLIVKK